MHESYANRKLSRLIHETLNFFTQFYRAILTETFLRYICVSFTWIIYTIYCFCRTLLSDLLSEIILFVLLNVCFVQIFNLKLYDSIKLLIYFVKFFESAHFNIRAFYILDADSPNRLGALCNLYSVKSSHILLYCISICGELCLSSRNPMQYPIPLKLMVKEI